jgi:hypothetical protein
MHATLTTATGSPEDMATVGTMVAEEMLKWTQQLEGFLGLIMLGSEQIGRVQVLTLWESRSIAESHLPARLRFRDRLAETVGAEVLETESYDVLFAEAPGLRSVPEA